MAREGRAIWAKRIEEWKRSSLSADEYAATIGVRPKTLTWWSWRIGSKRAARKKRKAKAIAVAPPMTFVEMTHALPVDPIEIVLTNEVRVRVMRSFDEATLVRVLHVLEAK